MDTVGGTQQLWSKNRGRIDATPLAGTSGALAPTFSPDGEWIAFVADGKVKRVPRAGGSAITVSDSANSDIPAVAWLDDGTVLFNNPAYDLRAVSVDGGAQRRWYWIDSLQRGVVSATALPGGRGALLGLCTLGCPSADLRVLDLRSGELRILVDEVLKGWYLPTGAVVFVRRDGGVFSVPFDLDGLTFRSAPLPVMEGVRTSNALADMALSASGTLLYVAGRGQATGASVEAVWVTRDGAVTPVDSSWNFVPAANAGVALSPDGRRLAVGLSSSGTEEIWIKELPRGPLTRLTFTGANSRPAWSADGRSVLYLSAGTSLSSDLRVRRADGTGSERTLLDHSRGVFQVVLTPDTSRLIVRFGAPPSRDIYLMTRSGDSAAVSPLVATDGFSETSAALSPDG